MFRRFNLLNDDPGAGGGTGTPANQVTPPAPTNTNTATPPASTGLDFIPESFRSESWATKYQTAEDFFKGVSNMSKMMGQKEVVEGLKVPADDASADDWSKFYTSIGRPETADKYEYSADIKVHEGLNIEDEKTAISNISHSLGLTKKQAEGVFKAYAERTNTFFAKSQEQVEKKFNEVLEQTFGKDFKSSFDLAKRGAKSLEGADKINLEDVSNPIALRALAKLGEYVGEDSFETGGKGAGKDSLLAEARELQKSQKYKDRDPATVSRVSDIYREVYPN